MDVSAAQFLFQCLGEMFAGHGDLPFCPLDNNAPKA
jgi:hypothetical protein